MKPSIESTSSGVQFGDVPASLRKATSPVGGFMLSTAPQTHATRPVSHFQSPPVFHPHSSSAGFPLQSSDTNSMSSEDVEELELAELAGLVHEQDSGYSDTNPDKTSPRFPKSPRGPRTPVRRNCNSPQKRKRVRKSRAKVQDPAEKNVLRKTRRCRANDRERTRMHSLNDTLELLRLAIPFDGANGKMTKIETLRGAINYIMLLKTAIEQDDKAMLDQAEAAAAGCLLTVSSAPTSFTPPPHRRQQIGSPGPVRSASACGNLQDAQFVQYPESRFTQQPPQYPGNSMLSVNVSNLCAIGADKSSPSFHGQGSQSDFNSPQPHPSPCSYPSPANTSPNYPTYPSPATHRLSPTFSALANNSCNFDAGITPSTYIPTNVSSNNSFGGLSSAGENNFHSSLPAGGDGFQRYSPPANTAYGQFQASFGQYGNTSFGLENNMQGQFHYNAQAAFPLSSLPASQHLQSFF